MKMLATSLIVIGMFLSACSSLNKVNSSQGNYYGSDIGINLYQGPDENGVFLGEVQTGKTVMAVVPSGFEMVTGVFSNNRGGNYTESMNLVSGKTYYFVLSQKAGVNTPDVVVAPSSGDDYQGTIKSGMAVVYFSYPNTQAKQAQQNIIDARKRLQEQLHCSDAEMRNGTCQ